ncbi:putative pectate lyase 2 [Platanthera guangdongensis]|uniref:Pectate lyase n=1 Tax=Platanthera guangdongensis TaxID=2320717 RepID=A0ABR2LFU2_9ASPA
MEKPFLSFLLLLFSPTLISSLPYYYPTTKNILNPIDSCWRADPNWSNHRQNLANCAVGFGASAMGGKYGPIYIVTDSSDDPINPKPGTLRYAAIQDNPLWIIFSRSMSIRLRNELIMNSYKTIDGRGASVSIGGGGPCITIQNVNHIIVHGIVLHGCARGSSGNVRSSPEHVGHRIGSHGDGVNIWHSTDVWIDHCSMSECYDGLVDVTHGSTRVTKRVEGNWKNWKWRSTKDVFLNGAYFVPSGWGSCSPGYSAQQQFYVAPGTMVPSLTSNAGVLNCLTGKACVY